MGNIDKALAFEPPPHSEVHKTLRLRGWSNPRRPRTSLVVTDQVIVNPVGGETGGVRGTDDAIWNDNRTNVNRLEYV